jgi:hypothetical protein
VGAPRAPRSARSAERVIPLKSLRRRYGVSSGAQVPRGCGEDPQSHSWLARSTNMLLWWHGGLWGTICRYEQWVAYTIVPHLE